MSDTSCSYFVLIQQFRAEYWKLFLTAFKDGLRLVEKIKNSGEYIGTHSNFPTLTFRKNGLPDFSSRHSEIPLNYSNCFTSSSDNALANEDEIDSFNKLVQYVRSHKTLLKRFSLSAETQVTEKTHQNIEKHLILMTLKQSIDHYIHEFNTFEYQNQFAEKIVDSVLSYIFDERLKIDIYVPILFWTLVLMNTNFQTNLRSLESQKSSIWLGIMWSLTTWVLINT